MVEERIRERGRRGIRTDRLMTIVKSSQRWKDIDLECDDLLLKGKHESDCRSRIRLHAYSHGVIKTPALKADCENLKLALGCRRLEVRRKS